MRTNPFMPGNIPESGEDLNGHHFGVVIFRRRSRPGADPGDPEEIVPVFHICEDADDLVAVTEQLEQQWVPYQVVTYTPVTLTVRKTAVIEEK